MALLLITLSCYLQEIPVEIPHGRLVTLLKYHIHMVPCFHFCAGLYSWHKSIGFSLKRFFKL